MSVLISFKIYMKSLQQSETANFEVSLAQFQQIEQQVWTKRRNYIIN